MTTDPPVSASVVVPKAALQSIFDNLRATGFTLIGPRRSGEGAIVLDEITRLDELPLGWTDEQAPGSYRLKRTQPRQYFSFTVGPHSWKQFLHPPRFKLFSVEKNNGNWLTRTESKPAPRYAFIGVRACDLHAIAVQDRVLLGGEFRDPHYAEQREHTFLLAVNCSRASASCFCTSMKTGPRAAGGFDLALTELEESFVVEISSKAGAEMLRNVPAKPATALDLSLQAKVIEAAERTIQRAFRTDDLPKLLYDNLEHPRWESVAVRCLACANCTMVCPTCFCTTVEDLSNLRATLAERIRLWDSCFSLDFSHVHGGNIRPSILARYRQWLTHKFASWTDQFGSSGCVGCGRCITWCPVAIDVREEINAIREGAN